MKKIDSILSLCTLLTLQTIYSQVNLEWAKRYNGPANASDRAFAIAVDAGGNVYVTGLSAGIGTNADYATIKYNSIGDTIWVRRYNGPENGLDVARDITLDTNGYIYITGVVTIKYNAIGDSLWVRRFIGSGSEGIKLTFDHSSASVYVGGNSLSDYALIKYFDNGNLEWSMIYNGPANNQDRLYDIGLDPWGNVVVTGGSWGIGTQWDYATIKYSPSGDEMWVRRYNGPAQDVPTDIAYALAVDDSGNVYVTGQSDGTNENPNCFTIKYNTEGDTIWTRRYPILSAGYDIELDNFGNLYIAARTNGINYTVLKYTGNGDLIWERTKPGEAFADPHSIAVDSAGNVYLACSRFVSSIRSDILIVKYDSSGNQRWEASYNGGSNNDVNFPNDITIGANGNVYVAGQCIGTGTLFDYVTIKYSQVTGITQINNELPHAYSLQQNYPNPFNPVTRIRFQLKDAGAVNLAIYDMLGKEIETLVSEELKPGTYETEWNAANLPSGVYFYRLSSSEFREIRKAALIK